MNRLNVFEMVEGRLAYIGYVHTVREIENVWTGEGVAWAEDMRGVTVWRSVSVR